MVVLLSKPNFRNIEFILYNITVIHNVLILLISKARAPSYTDSTILKIGTNVGGMG